MDLSGLSFQKFVDFALDHTRLRTTLTPHLPSQKFKSIKAKDGNKAVLTALSFQSPKIRLLRSLAIADDNAMRVLDFGVFPEPEYDLPIFCANFFATASRSIVVLDYKEKYFKKLMPLGQKYAELFPWGGKITSESMKFFSPIVIWTTFSTSRDKHDDLYSAFVDYYKAWLELMDEAVEEKDVPQILHNREAQHKYLTWRAEKDPGYPLLKKLVGESLAKDLVRNFLFEGVDTLGTNTFLDYFPEYRCEDGGVNQKRSMIGKSYETRPWDAKGEFTGG
ncbi:phytochromobilin:ferredoxin oxidoreductase, chloroplastic isoform X1 [Ananas comosus]|uniref:Phytochromobilin:ferredoxin oxidoreductase, chloroplastic isoform X1 n=1 Tax=Ananas comosus TaxID=4615 RepID=A0A6P5EV95_ANACO|nr:phytochromobilin:ferredoxin oxidoreductase, chloroplastic isoform X1 [Ananas comosus]